MGSLETQRDGVPMRNPVPTEKKEKNVRGIKVGPKGKRKSSIGIRYFNKRKFWRKRGFTNHVTARTFFQELFTVHLLIYLLTYVLTDISFSPRQRKERKRVAGVFLKSPETLGTYGHFRVIVVTRQQTGVIELVLEIETTLREGIRDCHKDSNILKCFLLDGSCNLTTPLVPWLISIHLTSVMKETRKGVQSLDSDFKSNMNKTWHLQSFFRYFNYFPVKRKIL